MAFDLLLPLSSDSTNLKWSVFI